jgi:SMODS and SLOG-associating 2TM effector domain
MAQEVHEESSIEHVLDSIDNGAPIAKNLNALATFQNVVGISAIPKDDFKKHGRPAPNKGIYQEIVNREYWCRLYYYACTTLINSCLLLQIIFAATLTALGASSSPHDVITVFGAINTALAGMVALMKGHGLPNRARQDWQELRKLRDNIEQLERCLEEGLLSDVRHDIAIIFKKYDEVLQIAEDNRPDSYVRSLTPSSTSSLSSSTK